MANPYANQLHALLTNPSSFSGTPGFQFARDNGVDAVSRSMASKGMGYSGNALGEIAKYATGLAGQDYGNQIDRLGRLSGQEQQYDLGLGQNANAATRTANDYSLGTGQLANTRTANDQQFGLGMYRAGNDFALGNDQNANTRQRNWWDYKLGSDQNANAAANNENNFNVNAFNAQTQRGTAQSQDWWNPQRQARMPLTRRYV